MGNPEHIKWLLGGVEAWNKRLEREPFKPDLRSENFLSILGVSDPGDSDEIVAQLSNINFSNADLSDACLKNIDLTGAQFTWANLTRADFSGAWLTGTQFFNVILTKAYLPGADLTDAHLRNVDLSDAVLVSSNFTRTKLINSTLTRALLSSATLDNTQFAGCNLDSADFRDTKIMGAWFSECYLEGAHLYKADLIDTDFILSRPWEARLYRPTSQPKVDSEPLPRERIETLDGLLNACRNFIKAVPNLNRDNIILYFRGERCCSWDLRPCVMREPALRSTEGEMLNDLMTRQPEAFNGLNSALAQWVLAQHHGLKTRLLDVTRNPLVALFNACTDKDGNLDDEHNGLLHVFGVPKSLIKPFNSDTVSVIANFAKLSRSEQNLLLGKDRADDKDDQFPHIGDRSEMYAKAKDRLYYIIRQERPNFRERIDARDLFRVFIVEPQQKFERIRAQSGAFLMSAFHERFEWNEVLQWNKDTPIYLHYLLELPKELKSQILQDLQLLNVTRETLLPSIDEAASAITQQYRDRAGQIRGSP